MWISKDKLKEIVGQVVDRKIASAITYVQTHTIQEIRLLENNLKWKQVEVDKLKQNNKMLEQTIQEKDNEIKQLKDVIVKEKINNEQNNN